ncbi:MAG: S8 family serine peptidase [Nanoarchaeota archaeon]|nr:S8 family serine peptidase [Nanoarchaeota archaeon]MBU4351533.1 S8 family serine peptidase [Nanoarchaeota archaeon]MBU4456475.1 S8 family serine peptidase [Nanoarchaeota archaeon]MCG2720097.1 S8 family serine peptidase [Nanoarchaeota archaeon]
MEFFKKSLNLLLPAFLAASCVGDIKLDIDPRIEGTTEKVEYKVGEEVKLQGSLEVIKSNLVSSEPEITFNNLKPAFEELVPVEKLESRLKVRNFAKWNTNELGDRGFNVTFNKNVNEQKAKEILSSYGAEIINNVEKFNSFSVVVNKENVEDFLNKLSEKDEIQYIAQPPVPLSDVNNFARKISKSRILDVAIPGLEGDGILGCVYDGGYADINHKDLEGRAVIGEDLDNAYISSHATHVACTLGGDGVATLDYFDVACQFFYGSEFKEFCKNYLEMGPEEKQKYTNLLRGVASKVKLISHEHGPCEPYCLYNTPNKMLEKYLDVIEQGVSFITNSIGSNTTKNGYSCDINGSADDTSRLIDAVVAGLFDNNPVTILYAAGNERSASSLSPKRCFADGDAVGYDTLGAPSGGSKNAIIIGAAELDAEGRIEVAHYSSLGPTDDGRVGVTVVNYGGGTYRSVMSCLPGNYYGGMSGTSMATPATAGVVAKLVQAYRQKYGVDPSPSLIKAVLTNTAKDIDNKYVDFKSGFGLVDAFRAYMAIATGSFVEDEIQETGMSHKYYFNVKDKSPIQVLMAYTDLPGIPERFQVLVNDLDLELIAPSGKVYQPYTLDPNNPSEIAKRSHNRRDNIEQVIIHSDEVEQGLWGIKITGYKLSSTQDYSLTFTPSPFKTETALINNNGSRLNAQLEMNVKKQSCIRDFCEWQDLGKLVDVEKTLMQGTKYLIYDLFPGFIPKEKGHYRIEILLKNERGNLWKNNLGEAKRFIDFYVLD